MRTKRAPSFVASGNPNTRGLATSQVQPKIQSPGDEKAQIQKPILETKQILVLVVSPFLQYWQDRYLDHSRRTTQKRNTLLPWLKGIFMKNLLVHMSLLARPVFRRVRKHVRDLELVRIFCCVLVEFAAHQDIFLGLVGIDGPDLGSFPLFCPQNSCNKLISRCNARSSQNQRDVIEMIRLVVDAEFAVPAVSDLACGAFYFDLLAFLKTVKNIAHCAAWLCRTGEVRFDDKVECAVFFGLQDGPGRGVWANDKPVLEVEADLKMLASFQAEPLVSRWELKGVALRVFR